jgi:uncharacterized membrane protein YbhN (UPF0104 family)
MLTVWKAAPWMVVALLATAGVVLENLFKIRSKTVSRKRCHKIGVRSGKATSMNFSFISLSAGRHYS